MKKLLLLILFTILYSTQEAWASHLVGGSITYSFLGDSLTYKIYEVKLVIYQDAIHGQAQSIAEDNPAYIGVYSNDAAAGYPLVRADSAFYSSADTVASGPLSICAGPFPILILKKTFIIHYALPANPTGYAVVYQRCCNNGAIINIRDPSDNGNAYSCTIPAAPVSNSSAVFNQEPPFMVRLNAPLSYNFSAADPDGDSLSYGFTTAFYGATNTNIKPFPPGPPPFDTVLGMPGFSSQYPITSSPAVHPDASTGIISGQPDHLGRFLVAVYCKEWRAGTLINTTITNFQVVTTDCVSAVPEVEEAMAKIYPNPATGSLTVKSAQNITSIAISNIFGQTVYSTRCNGLQVQIPTTDLSRGIYFVKVNDVITTRFVKE